MRLESRDLGIPYVKSNKEETALQAEILSRRFAWRKRMADGAQDNVWVTVIEPPVLVASVQATLLHSELFFF